MIVPNENLSLRMRFDLVVREFDKFGGLFDINCRLCDGALLNCRWELVTIYVKRHTEYHTQKESITGYSTINRKRIKSLDYDQS